MNKVRLSVLLLVVAAIGGALNALAGLIASEYVAVGAYSAMAIACVVAAAGLWRAEAGRESRRATSR